MVANECVAKFANIYGIHFEPSFFNSKIESWPKWGFNPRPRAHPSCSHAITTELSR